MQAPELKSTPKEAASSRLRRAALALVMLSAIAVLLYAKAIPCGFARMFGQPCPGCGSTRACVALLHGHLDDVVRFNPLGPVMAVFLGAFALQALVSVVLHGDLREAGEGRIGRVIKRGIFVVAALEMVLWIARFFGAFGGPVPV